MGYLFPGDPSSWLQPDVSIPAADQPGDRYYEGAPLMAFEIVSEHDRAGELDRKVGEYLDTWRGGSVGDLPRDAARRCLSRR